MCREMKRLQNVWVASHYGTVHRKGNDNSTSRITVFGKSTSSSVNFWQLSTDRHGALTGNGNVWQLTVLHLHMCVGIYAESISRRRRYYPRYHEQRYRDSEICRQRISQIRRQGVQGVALQDPKGKERVSLKRLPLPGRRDRVPCALYLEIVIQIVFLGTLRPSAAKTLTILP